MFVLLLVVCYQPETAIKRRILTGNEGIKAKRELLPGWSQFYRETRREIRFYLIY